MPTIIKQCQPNNKMEITLAGKRALIGGSTSGIGKAIALQMAQSGASITLMARNETRLKKLLEVLPAHNGRQHQYLVVDFTDFENYREHMQHYFRNNQVDILVNNTQGPISGSALEVSINDYQKAFDLLFKTTVLNTELALKGMIQNQWGRIVNVASISVKEPLPYLALSNSIRAAVVTWAKTLATEVGKHGITINSILTGYFDTERLTHINTKKAEQMGVPLNKVVHEMITKVPLQRIGKPEEYGFLATFLASEKAAFITGTNIPIDGGLLKSL